eukprot:TRINITY_DN1645_c0_g4_i1.p1 TRINITY_DN1645_c0_g4~~TRINITY_DN1645_c0_g4_i1.p1  ORF type:complete len:282 (-),score=42.89 TRINITY_DN1645_c0_g4_i1:51-896(-)
MPLARDTRPSISRTAYRAGRQAWPETAQSSAAFLSAKGRWSRTDAEPLAAASTGSNTLTTQKVQESSSGASKSKKSGMRKDHSKTHPGEEKESEKGKNATKSKAARHRRAIAESPGCKLAADEIQQRLSLLRLVFATARRLHTERSSFLTRQNLLKDLSDDGERCEARSVWLMIQCPIIFREVVTDVISAARSIRNARGGIAWAGQRAKLRSKLLKLMLKKWPKITAMAAFNEMLADLRDAEECWGELLQSVKPKRRQSTSLHASLRSLKSLYPSSPVKRR